MMDAIDAVKKELDLLERVFSIGQYVAILRLLIKEIERRIELANSELERG